MKTIRNFRTILLLISGMLFFNSCDNFNKQLGVEKQLQVEDLNNHQFRLHKKEGGRISVPFDRSFSRTLPEGVEGKNDFQFIYNTETMKYNLKFKYDINLDVNGIFTLNEDKNMIILDDDLFFTYLDYSGILRLKATRYGLIKKHIRFNQDSTLTFEYIKTDVTNYTLREMDERSDITRSEFMSDREFNEITKKRLAEHSSGNKEISGHYYILK